MRSILLVAVLALSSGAALGQECVSCWNDTCTQLKSYGFPSCKPKAPPKAECPSGQETSEDTNGHCCWPGQSWSRGACIGSPTKCPSGFQYTGDKQACEAMPCPDGKEREDGEHCCWKGQAWNKGRKTCVGAPACPAHFHAALEACVANPSVKFEISPEGATLSVDGKKQQCAQSACQLELSAGKHELKVEAEGFKPQTRRIDATSESTTETFSLEKLPLVRFESEPKGASVSVDGKVACPATPCTVMVEPGQHVLKMEMPAHDAVSEARSVAPGDTVKMVLSAIVQVRFDSKPLGAVVVLDKAVVCPSTPCTAAVREGTHEVFMVLPDGTLAELATAVAEQTKGISLALRPVDPSRQDDASTALLKRTLSQPEVSQKAKEAMLTETAVARGPRMALELSSLFPGAEALRKRLRCDAGSGGAQQGAACEEVADDLAASAPAVSAGYYAKACDADQKKSCNLLGQWALTGTNTPREPARAAKLFDKACTLGLADACMALAAGWGTSDFGKPDAAAVTSALGRACKLGKGEACTTLGNRMMASGLPDKEDKAKAFYDSGCSGGDQAGCAAARKIDDARRARDQDRQDAELQRARAARLLRSLMYIGIAYGSLSTTYTDNTDATKSGDSASLSGFGAEFGLQVA